MQEQLKTIREAWHIAQPYLEAHDLGNKDYIHKAIVALTQLEAMVGEQEPVHWRAVLDPEQVPQQLKTTMHVVGFREKKAAEGFVAEQIDFFGWRYTIEPLYASPVAQQPQGEVIVTWNHDRTCILAVTRQDREGRILKVIAEAPAQQPQAESVLRKLEWAEVRHEYREAEYFCPICDRDKRQGHEAGCELAAALTHQQAEAVPSGSNPYPARGSITEAWQRGFDGRPMLAYPGSNYAKVYAEGQAARAAQQQAEAVPINYSPLYEFADKNRVSYNELCAAVQAAIAQQKGNQ